jgi:hypothetical protein
MLRTDIDDRRAGVDPGNSNSVIFAGVLKWAPYRAEPQALIDAIVACLACRS